MGSGGGVFEGERRPNTNVAPRYTLSLESVWQSMLACMHLAILRFVYR